MVIGAEVVVFPATSVATAVSVCWPLAILFVFQLFWYGADGSLPRLVPSRKNSTFAMPDGAPVPVPKSVAVAVMVTLQPWLMLDPPAGTVIETDGAAPSIWITWVLTASVLPALSTEKNFTVVVPAP